MQRTDIHAITFIARCESGLHIGGSQDELVIGGSDNPVIKNPANGRPYIPGSSLKEKMRAELEQHSGKSGGRNGDTPCGCAEDSCAVCRLFGAHMNTVVEGTEFDLQIMLQAFDLDSGFSYQDPSGTRHRGDAALQAVVAHGLRLVQLTGLGGGTSRGSGAVSFRDFKLDGMPWDLWSD